MTPALTAAEVSESVSLVMSFVDCLVFLGSPSEPELGGEGSVAGGGGAAGRSSSWGLCVGTNCENTLQSSELTHMTDQTLPSAFHLLFLCLFNHRFCQFSLLLPVL